MFKLLTAFAMTTLYAPVYAGLFDYSPAKGVMYPEKGGKGEGTHIFDAYRSTCTSYVIKEGNYESIWIGQKYNGCIYFYDTSDCNPDNDENYLYQQSLYVETSEGAIIDFEKFKGSDNKLSYWITPAYCHSGENTDHQ